VISSITVTPDRQLILGDVFSLEMRGTPGGTATWTLVEAPPPPERERP